MSATPAGVEGLNCWDLDADMIQSLGLLHICLCGYVGHMLPESQMQAGGGELGLGGTSSKVGVLTHFVPWAPSVVRQCCPREISLNALSEIDRNM